MDSEFENGRHKVFNFAMSTMDVHRMNEKLDAVFDSLKCAAKVNMAFGFVLKNVEDGKCRYYYAHENNTLLERSQLVATKEDLLKIKSTLSNTDVIESCVRERFNTKVEILQARKFYRVCSSTQRSSNGMQRCSFARTFIEK